MDDRRPARWALGAGIASALIAGLGGLLWWKLPVWQPAWVARHSPFVEPVLRAAWLGTGSVEDQLELRLVEWGASATPALVRWARVPEQRLMAIQLLIRCGDDRAIVPARRWLSDADDEIAAHALRLMTRLAPAEIAAWLPGELARRGCHEDGWTSACAESLVTLVDPGLLPLALRLAVEARSYDPLLHLLREAPTDRIAELLVGSDPTGQAAMLTAFGTHRGMRPWPPDDDVLSAAVLRLGVSDERQVRRAALALLPRLGQMAVPTMGRALLEEHDPLIRSDACALLSRMGDPACLPYVARALDEFPWERYALTRLVAGLEDQEADRLLIALLADPSDLIRFVAVNALAATGREPPPFALFADRLHDSEAGTRCAAASLAGFARCSHALSALTALLADPADEVAAEAAAALGRIGDASAVPALGAALGPDRPEVREAAVLALGSISDERVLPLLTGVVEGDADQDLRALALAVLERRLENPAEREALRARHATSVPPHLLREAGERVADHVSWSPPPRRE